jgi:hypothetical protein
MPSVSVSQEACQGRWAFAGADAEGNEGRRARNAIAANADAKSACEEADVPDMR